MLKGSSDSDTEVSGEEDLVGVQASVGRFRPVLRPAQLRVPGGGTMEEILANQVAQQQALQAGMQQQVQQIGSHLEIAKLQAATCLDLRKDIASIDKFTGETGELNHFLRSGDGVNARITTRVTAGRLDELDAESLRGALNRRVQRGILNRLQADESTPWSELKRRLQKEYGGGRWTPEEDALRMLRLKRGPRQTRGSYAALLLASFQQVVDKFRETLPGPEANTRIGVIESLAIVQLSEAAGRQLSGSLTEAANGLIDAAGRGEEETDSWKPVNRELYPERRRREEPRVVRRDDGRGRWETPRRNDRPKGGPRPARRGEDRRCHGCGQKGHLQARCPQSRCYECNTPGHMARNCPYMRPRRQGRDEPMEVNEVKRNKVSRQGGRKRAGSRQETTDGEEDDNRTEGVSSDDEASIHTYAAVLRRGHSRQPPGMRSQSR